MGSRGWYVCHYDNQLLFYFKSKWYWIGFFKNVLSCYIKIQETNCVGMDKYFVLAATL